MNNDRCEIGKIVGAHGVRGDMLLIPLTDFPERFLDMKTLDVEVKGKPRRTYTISRMEPYEGKNTFFARLKGINDRDAAEMLKGASVTVSKDERVKLEEGEYWLDDIIGLEVFDEEGVYLGKITEILFTGSNDVYIVKTPQGALKALPALESVIKEISIEQGVMKVRLPEGLWD